MSAKGLEELLLLPVLPVEKLRFCCLSFSRSLPTTRSSSDSEFLTALDSETSLDRSTSFRGRLKSRCRPGDSSVFPRT